MKKIILCFVFLLVATELMSQWLSQPSPTTADLNSIKFINPNVAYIAGDSETIVKTSNGGLNWSVVNKVYNNLELNSISFIDENTGFIVGGEYGNGINTQGKIYKTTNGGNNWTTYITDSICYCCVWFINSNTGFAGGIPKPRSNPYPCFYKTTNCGNSWFSIIDINSSVKFDIYFLNQNTGWTAGDGTASLQGTGIVYKTTNGGNNWFALGEQAWGVQYYSVFFLNETIGWITGIQTNPWGGLLRKTTNGGLTWAHQNNSNLNELYKTYFINENTGWVVGDFTGNGNIQKTTNGGAVWNRQYSNANPSWCKDIYMFNENTGWIVGANGTILKTTNGGGFLISGNIRYRDNNQPVTTGYVKAYRYESGTGNIIVIDSALIQSNGSYILNNIPEADLYIGAVPNSSPPADYVFTYYPSSIYWEKATMLHPTGNLTNININVYRLTTLASSNYVGGKVNSVNPIAPLKDANLYAKSGNNFYGFNISNLNGIYSINSLPSGSLKILADRMGYKSDSITVNLTDNFLDSVNFYLTKVLVGINPISNLIPDKYYLHQNYPNPFNPTTNIRFQIKDSRFVTLKIFDVLGKEIATLVNDNLKAGQYEATFDGNSMASGIYIYRLTAGNFNEVKKMVLIK
jgi:photosystem II stability/assembly factor-like uncharacterized protein